MRVAVFDPGESDKPGSLSLDVLRNTSAGALPGQALVLLDPQRMVISDAVLCEDGHAQERSLLDQVLARVEARDLLIDDRNFCTLGFLFGVAARKAFYITSTC